jgi:hypothetical protein
MCRSSSHMTQERPDNCLDEEDLPVGSGKTEIQRPSPDLQAVNLPASDRSRREARAAHRPHTWSAPWGEFQYEACQRLRSCPG